MPRITRDPLLAIARIVLILIQAVTGFAAAICLVAVPAMLLFKARATARIVAEGVPAETFWAVIALLTCAAIALALVFWAARLIARMVKTVGEGDPFVPENADRLSRTAWIMLAVQVIGIPIGAMANWIDAVTEGSATNNGDAISVSAILLVLILFILARVFRRGTEMREELEGTV